MTTYYYQSVREFLEQTFDWVDAQEPYQAVDYIELYDPNYRLRMRFKACQKTITKVKSALRRRSRKARSPRNGSIAPDPVRQGIAYGRWVRSSGLKAVHLYSNPAPRSRALKASVAVLATVLGERAESDATAYHRPDGTPTDNPGITQPCTNHTPYGVKLIDHYHQLLDRARAAGYDVRFVDTEQQLVTE